MVRPPFLLTVLTLMFTLTLAHAQGEHTRTKDVIYGRKAGMALTLDVFTPKKDANGIGLIAVASGGWMSNPDMIQPIAYHEFLRRGFTVFAVVHGSQPMFTIPEILDDMHQAVRYIRVNAKTYQVDPERLGILGASSGGHLSLMQGTAGMVGNPKAANANDRISSRVQAVVAFYPPTDFLNYGKPGNEMIDRAFQPPFTAAVDYKEFDNKRALFIPVTDKMKLREISRKVSPITHVSASSAPALLFHGDKDELVPLQQSQSMVASLKNAGVPAELVEWKGIAHGNLFVSLQNLPRAADWFDTHLVKRPMK